MYELTRGAREHLEDLTFVAKLRAIAFDRIIDTPGCGYLRMECLCGHKATLHGVGRGDVLFCDKCKQAMQTAIWPSAR
ncbi:MAG: hypothetical protein KF750_14280 [Xanthobacteraceae bacterium]|nr:hypothetical protein [Xanthobacteraceae bacterium]